MWFLTVIFWWFLQAQSDDDDVPDEVAVTVEPRDGFMDEFFAEVCTIDPLY